MSGTRWFGHVDMGASYASELVVLEELERVLDAARPGNVDPHRSAAVDGLFIIAHATNRTADIYIEVNEDCAALDCMITQQKVRSTELGTEWMCALARAVDQVIRGQYVVDRTYLRSKIIRTTIRTQGQNNQSASRWSRLPIPQRFQTHERIEFDYGCNPV